MKQAKDGDLLLAFQPGNEAGFRVLYRRFKGPLVGYAQTLTGDRDSAEEVVHDVLTGLLHRRARSDSEKEMQNLLFTSVRNRALNLLRGRKTQAAFVRERGGYLLHHPGAPSNAAAAAEEAELNLLLSGLPAEQREAVYLKVFCEYTYAEIGELLGEPLGTIRSRCNYGLKKIETWLQREERP